MMDSSCDFDLLGGSVPQVLVSACTMALLRFFIVQCILTSLLLIKYFYKLSTLEEGVLSCLTRCTLGAGKYVRVPLGGTWNIFDGDQLMNGPKC